jgi:hypothetical protein
MERENVVDTARRAHPADRPTAEEQLVLREVLAALRATSHGTVALIIQDGRVVQIDRTEKKRLDR